MTFSTPFWVVIPLCRPSRTKDMDWTFCLRIQELFARHFQKSSDMSDVTDGFREACYILCIHFRECTLTKAGGDLHNFTRLQGFFNIFITAYIHREIPSRLFRGGSLDIRGKFCLIFFCPVVLNMHSLRAELGNRVWLSLQMKTPLITLNPLEIWLTITIYKVTPYSKCAV